MKDCKLIADYENGEGEVKLSDRFNDENSLLRADILQDWMGLLTFAYNVALSDMRAEWSTNRPKVMTKKDAALRLKNAGISGIEAKHIFDALNSPNRASSGAYGNALRYR